MYHPTKISVAALLCASLGSAVADEKVQTYHIPAQSLHGALQKFADQAGIAVFFSDSQVQGKSSPTLQGSYSPREALEKLLAGSGLTYTFTDENSVSVKAADSKSDASSTLPAMRVVGTAEYDSTDPYNTDYNRPNAVTATKTDTPLIQTPFSVKVVPQQVLKDQQAITVDQALRNVSGVVTGSGGTGTFFIRGFGNYNVYRDGYLNQSQWAHTEDLENVERVEVLKGPGSVLYGRTEPGGLVNFVTKQPLDTAYYSLRQQFGSFSHYRTSVDATGPLTDSKDLAYRFNLGYQSNNTFQEFGSDERLFVAPSLRWNISDQTTSTVKIEYSDIKELGRGTVPLLGNRPAPIPRSRNLGEPWNIQEDEYFMLYLNTEHAFNDDWRLRHRFNFSNYTLTMSGKFPTGAFSPVQPNGDKTRFFFAENIDDNDYQHNFFNALELNGKFDTGFLKHNLLLGGDYYRTDYRATSAGFTPKTGDITNIYHPIHQSGPPAILPGDVDLGEWTLPWFGLYAQDQIELPYHLHALAGLRYDNATSTWHGSSYPDTSADKVSPRGGLVWQPIPEFSLYGSYTENFGASNYYDWSTETPLPPQTAQQWEVGAKTELFDGRFSATLAYFDLTKQNLPMEVGPNITKAVGEAESRGVEFDLSGEILPGWSIIGAYAYTPFAKTTKDSAGFGNTGKRLNNAPVHSASLWTTYEFQKPLLRGVRIGAGMQAVGQREIGYDETAQAPGYVTMNVMLSKFWKIGASRVTAQLNIDNLTDKTYIASIYSYGPSHYGAPRTFMGSVRIEY